MPLASLPTFADLPDDALQALRAASVERFVRRGTVLVEEGDPPDRVFAVLAGRFEVQMAGRGLVAEIGAGELIGEIGFFSGQPRNATVVAIRDSTVLELRHADFDRLAAERPVILRAVITSLARRLGATAREVRPLPTFHRPRAVVAIPAGGRPLPPAFADAFRRSGVRVLDREALESALPGRPLASAEMAEGLSALEASCELVVYLAGPDLDDFARAALGQSDEILLVVQDADPPPLSALEEAALRLLPAGRRRLVRLHAPDTRSITGTAAYLERRPAAMVHHVADPRRDGASLLRILTGRAVGLVAGGGGGFGPAQIGIIKAFVEAGITFDVCGGTSFGSATAAGFAFRTPHDELVDGIDDIFVRRRAFSRRTIPRYGLLDHTVFDAALKAVFGDRRIEDAWHPFFAVATDISENRIAILDRGPLWQAVRASASIPAVLPPVVTEDGRLIIDGAVMDNVPLGPMKALKAGPNLVVHFGLPTSRRWPVSYHLIPSRWRLIAGMLTAAGRRRLPPLPGPVSVVHSALTLHQPAAGVIAATDLILEPPPFSGSSLLDFSRHRDVTLESYDWAVRQIAALEAAGDPALAAIRRALQE